MSTKFVTSFDAHVTRFAIRWFDKASAIGVTAGASAPEVLVQEVINTLEKSFATTLITNKKATENVHFQLPKELRA